jgi:hypothetical protein
MWNLDLERSANVAPKDQLAVCLDDRLEGVQAIDLGWRRPKLTVVSRSTSPLLVFGVPRNVSGLGLR